MSPEKQRIAIAAACNLFRIAPLKRTTRKGKDDPLGVRLWYCDNDHGGAKEYAEVPYYLTDLNAMYKAEEHAFGYSIELWDVYVEWLIKIIDDPDNASLTHNCYICAHASASQRAEAFLKTLNLWEP